MRLGPFLVVEQAYAYVQHENTRQLVMLTREITQLSLSWLLRELRKGQLMLFQTKMSIERDSYTYCSNKRH